MYKVEGYELDLDRKMLEDYCRMTGDEIDSNNFESILKGYICVFLECDNVQDAVNIYGLKNISKTLSERLQDELNTIGVQE